MNEADLKHEFMREAHVRLPSWCIERHEDHFTHGLADITMTGHKKTAWIEVKYANPTFQCKGIQARKMQKLAVAGFAWFVVYYQDGFFGKTYIVEPKNIAQMITPGGTHKVSPNWNDFVEGFNHKFVIDFIRGQLI